MKILKGECRSLHGVGWIGISSIDVWPERASVGIQARFVGFDALAALLLSVILHLAKDTRLAVPIGVVTLAVLSPGFFLQPLLIIFANRLCLVSP